MKRFWGFGLLAIVIVVIGVIYYFNAQPKTVEDLLENGYPVLIDDYSVAARVESDRCQDFYDPKEYIPGEPVINQLLSINWAKDQITWPPFNMGKLGGGERTISFSYRDPDAEKQPRQGNYSIFVKDGRINISVDESCLPESGNIIMIPYEFNQHYDFSKATRFKFTVLEVQGKLNIHLAFRKSLSDSTEYYSTDDYEITSSGDHFINIQEYLRQMI